MIAPMASHILLRLRDESDIYSIFKLILYKINRPTAKKFTVGRFVLYKLRSALGGKLRLVLDHGREGYQGVPARKLGCGVGKRPCWCLGCLAQP